MATESVTPFPTIVERCGCWQRGYAAVFVDEEQRLRKIVREELEKFYANEDVEDGD